MYKYLPTIFNRLWTSYYDVHSLKKKKKKYKLLL